MDIKSLITISDEFGRLTKRSRARVSTLVFNQGRRLDDYASGGKSPTLRSLDAAVQWFSVHWPADAGWPPGVNRPEPVPGTEAS